jgi:hypothetical protein
MDPNLHAISAIHRPQGNKFERGEWWYYVFIIPLTHLMKFWVLAKKKVCSWLGIEVTQNSLLYDQPRGVINSFKVNAKEAKALDAAYNYEDKAINWLDHFWASRMLNTRGVRNRFRIVKDLLKSEIKKRIDNGQDNVRILSLASGTGQAEIEAIAELIAEGAIDKTDIKVILIDMQRWPLQKAKRLARESGVTEMVRCERKILRFPQADQDPQANITDTLCEFAPDVVATIGIQDYQNDVEFRLFIHAIHDGLADGDTLLTCNIAPNPEDHVLPTLLDWDIIYRSFAKLAGLAQESEFACAEFYVEPMEVYGILALHKN